MTASIPESIASQLVGVWTLVSYRHEQEGCEDSFPFGFEPEGFLTSHLEWQRSVPVRI
jgi:hypothetical protein